MRRCSRKSEPNSTGRSTCTLTSSLRVALADTAGVLHLGTSAGGTVRTERDVFVEVAAHDVPPKADDHTRDLFPQHKDLEKRPQDARKELGELTGKHRRVLMADVESVASNSGRAAGRCNQGRPRSYLQQLRQTCWRQRKRVTIPTETNSNDFGFFLELIGKFEFDLRRRGNYLENPIRFVVCSGLTHMQCDCTCARAVACLHPDKSIPNVVVSVTIHDDMYILALCSAVRHSSLFARNVIL